MAFVVVRGAGANPSYLQARAGYTLVSPSQGYMQGQTSIHTPIHTYAESISTYSPINHVFGLKQEAVAHMGRVCKLHTESPTSNGNLCTSDFLL